MSEHDDAYLSRAAIRNSAAMIEALKGMVSDETMTDAQPAMTPEEWARAIGAHESEDVLEEMAQGYYFYTTERNKNGVYVPRPEADHLQAIVAFANHRLPDGHPLKITREDVRLIGTRIRTLEPVESHPGWTDETALWRALAAKLAAYLPPEAPDA